MPDARSAGQRAMVEQAIAVAVNVHRGQVDKAGVTYILHPLRVMLDVDLSGLDAEHAAITRAAAVLHDAVEDAEDQTAVRATIRDCCGQDVVETVDIVTHRRDETYTGYILRVGRDDLATRIKLADLNDNTNPARLALLGTPPPPKYAEARRLLEGMRYLAAEVQKREPEEDHHGA